jgi:organic radical activating enzyme
MKIEYEDKSKNDWFLVTWDLSNKCNYRCSYCPQEIHDGSSGWPSIDDVRSFVKSITTQLSNKKICFRISGGEPTYWKYFIDFAEIVKKENHYFSFITNGSRDAQYFEKINSFVDGVIISYHPEYSDKDHFIKISKSLDCPVAVNLMMIPDQFDLLVETAKYLYENSNMAIWPKIILDKTTDKFITNQVVFYTEEQKTFLKNWPYFRNLDDSKIHRGSILYNGEVMTANDIFIKKLNHYKGWKCWAGIDMINIDFWGNVYRANCEQGGSLGTLNNFQLPKDKIICNKFLCSCLSDIYLRKEFSEPNSI